MSWIAWLINGGVLDHSLEGLSKGFWITLQLRAGCGTDRINKEGRKLPCEPETQPGLLQLTCWVGNMQCQTSGNEHKSRVIFGGTCGFCSHTRSQIKRCRHCPSRLHPMHWHKNMCRPQVHPTVQSQPTLNVQDNVPGSICRDISTEYPFRLWHDMVQVKEYLIFLERFGLYPPQNFLSSCKPLLFTISCGKHFHSLTTCFVKN